MEEREGTLNDFNMQFVTGVSRIQMPRPELRTAMDHTEDDEFLFDLEGFKLKNKDDVCYAFTHFTGVDASIRFVVIDSATGDMWSRQDFPLSELPPMTELMAMEEMPEVPMPTGIETFNIGGANYAAISFMGSSIIKVYNIDFADTYRPAATIEPEGIPGIDEETGVTCLHSLETAAGTYIAVGYDNGAVAAFLVGVGAPPALFGITPVGYQTLPAFPTSVSLTPDSTHPNGATLVAGCAVRDTSGRVATATITPEGMGAPITVDRYGAVHDIDAVQGSMALLHTHTVKKEKKSSKKTKKIDQNAVTLTSSGPDVTIDLPNDEEPASIHIAGAHAIVLSRKSSSDEEDDIKSTMIRIVDPADSGKIVYERELPSDHFSDVITSTCGPVLDGTLLALGDGRGSVAFINVGSLCGAVGAGVGRLRPETFIALAGSRAEDGLDDVIGSDEEDADM